MKERLVGMLVSWVLSQLTEDLIIEASDKVKGYVIPFIRDMKDDVIAKVREEIEREPDAYDAEKIKVLDAFDQFVEAFLPDNETCLKE